MKPTSIPQRFPFLPNVIYCNARSIAAKIDELQAVTDNNNANIVAISESWLNQTIPDSAINLTDLICFRRDRHNQGGGGVCCLGKILVFRIRLGEKW